MPSGFLRASGNYLRTCDTSSRWLSQGDWFLLSLGFLEWSRVKVGEFLECESHEAVLCCSASLLEEVTSRMWGSCDKT